MNWRAILIVAIIVIVCFVYYQSKKKLNMQKAESGEDKERVKQLMRSLLPPDMNCKIAYAHHEDVQHYGRSTRTTYYTYILAFDQERLIVSALGYEKGEPIPSRPGVISKDIVGVAEVSSYKDKEGRVKTLNIMLRDKDNKELLHCQVDAVNLREDRFHHFNILQQEELEELERMMQGFANVVNEENKELQERIHADSAKRERKSAIILGVLGILFCWTTIVGLIFGAIGMICAPKPKETGGKPTMPFILNCIALFLSLASLAACIYAINL